MVQGRVAYWTKDDPKFPPLRSLEKKEGKRMLMKMIGRVKKPIHIKHLFACGIFKEIRGLPRPWILDVGRKIAQRNSKHFQIEAHLNPAFASVPLFPVGDRFFIEDFHGAGLEKMFAYPMNDEWPENWKRKVGNGGQRSSSQHTSLMSLTHSEAEVCERRRLRGTDMDQWPNLMIYPWQFFGIELYDAALNIPKMRIEWNVPWLFIQPSVTLAKYTKSVYLSVFVDEKKRDPPERFPLIWGHKSYLPPPLDDFDSQLVLLQIAL